MHNVFLGLPLLIGTFGLGWYNWIRFDSITETGLKYQLTSVDYTSFSEIFSFKYFGRNFHKYFLHPVLLRPQFPFLFRIEYPFSSERMGGLFFIAPYITLALAPILRTTRALRETAKSTISFNRENYSEYWSFFTFSGSSIIGIVLILSYWWVEMRFLEDFMPSLLLFTGIGIGQELKTLETTMKTKRLLVFFTITLGVITIIAGVLVGLKSDSLTVWADMANTVLKILRIN